MESCCWCGRSRTEWLLEFSAGLSIKIKIWPTNLTSHHEHFDCVEKEELGGKDRAWEYGFCFRFCMASDMIWRIVWLPFPSCSEVNMSARSTVHSSTNNHRSSSTEHISDPVIRITDQSVKRTCMRIAVGTTWFPKQGKRLVQCTTTHGMPL